MMVSVSVNLSEATLIFSLYLQNKIKINNGAESSARFKFDKRFSNLLIQKFRLVELKNFVYLLSLESTRHAKKHQINDAL